MYGFVIVGFGGSGLVGQVTLLSSGIKILYIRKIIDIIYKWGDWDALGALWVLLHGGCFVSHYAGSSQ